MFYRNVIIVNVCVGKCNLHLACLGPCKHRNAEVRCRGLWQWPGVIGFEGSWPLSRESSVLATRSQLLQVNFDRSNYIYSQDRIKFTHPIFSSTGESHVKEAMTRKSL